MDYKLSKAEERAYQRVLKKRGIEQREDGLYKNGVKLSELIDKGPPRIEGKAAADLTRRLREQDRFRYHSLTKVRYKTFP